MKFEARKGTWPLAWMAAALLVAAGCARTTPPGLVELMTLTQMRHASLWASGRAGDWAGADRALEEIRKGLDDVVKFHPTHGDPPLPLAELVPRHMTKPVADLRGVVAAHDAPAFTAAFDALSAACNACHRATNVESHVVRRPGESG